MSDTKQITAAMVAAWAELPDIQANAETVVSKQGHKAKYSTFSIVMSTIKPVLAKHGLSVAQPSVPEKDGAHIATRLYHTSGEMLELGSVFIPADAANARAFGSALTYAKRRGLLAALGLVDAQEEDDDGKAATLAPKGDSIKSLKQDITTHIKKLGFRDAPEIIEIVRKARAHTKAPDSIEGWRSVLEFMEGYADGNEMMAFVNGSAADGMNGEPLI